MKTRSYCKLATAMSLAILVQPHLHAADHGHLNAGATGTNQNDRLIWANAGDFIDTAGYVKTLDYTNSGRYQGYYQQNITLTALPATAAHAGPDPLAPALGSVIQAKMACLETPPGGRFAFWEAGATTPTISLAAGESAANTWVLSQGDGSPGSDPYGHVHGRRFTASVPGVYKVSFQAIDTSTNGAGGGPIHTPSAELPVWFQAGVNVVEVEPDEEEGHVHVRFGARLGYIWQMEGCTNPGPDAVWLPAGNPVVGDDVFIETVHEGEPGVRRFYRVKGTPILP